MSCLVPEGRHYCSRPSTGGMGVRVVRGRRNQPRETLGQGIEMGQYEAGHATALSSAASYAPSRGGAPVVSFENVSKHYGNLHAVDGLTLDLRHGETVALLGPNGAGKSTSLDMLLALRKPSSGQIRMFGSDPYHAVKSGRVGAMLQSGGLMPEVTVRELG